MYNWIQKHKLQDNLSGHFAQCLFYILCNTLIQNIINVLFAVLIIPYMIAFFKFYYSILVMGLYIIILILFYRFDKEEKTKKITVDDLKKKIDSLLFCQNENASIIISLKEMLYEINEHLNNYEEYIISKVKIENMFVDVAQRVCNSLDTYCNINIHNKSNIKIAVFQYNDINKTIKMIAQKGIDIEPPYCYKKEIKLFDYVEDESQFRIAKMFRENEQRVVIYEDSKLVNKYLCIYKNKKMITKQYIALPGIRNYDLKLDFAIEMCIYEENYFESKILMENFVNEVLTPYKEILRLTREAQRTINNIIGYYIVSEEV